MKKLIIKSVVITTIINAVGVLANYLAAKLGDFLLIYVSLSGGEYRGYVGFGILLEHIYPMTDGTTPSKVTHISFSILNFITYYVLIFLVVFLIMYLVKRYKEKNKKREG